MKPSLSLLVLLTFTLPVQAAEPKVKDLAQERAQHAAQLEAVLGVLQGSGFQGKVPAQTVSELKRALQEWQGGDPARAKEAIARAIDGMGCDTPGLQAALQRRSGGLPQELQVQPGDSRAEGLLKTLAVSHPAMLGRLVRSRIQAQQEAFKANTLRSLRLKQLQQSTQKQIDQARADLEGLRKAAGAAGGMSSVPNLGAGQRLVEQQKKVARLEARQKAALEAEARNAATLDSAGLLRDPEARQAWESLKRTGDGKLSGLTEVSMAFEDLAAEAARSPELALQLLQEPHSVLNWLDSRAGDWAQNHLEQVQGAPVNPRQEQLSREFATNLRKTLRLVAEEGAKGKLRPIGQYASRTGLNDFEVKQARSEAQAEWNQALGRTLPRALSGVLGAGSVVFPPLLPVSLAFSAWDLGMTAATADPRKTPGVASALGNLGRDPALLTEAALFVATSGMAASAHLLKDAAALDRAAQALRPRNPQAFRAAFLKVAPVLTKAMSSPLTQSYFTFQALQGVSVAAALCQVPGKETECRTEVALALLNALPQGFDTYVALRSSAKACAVGVRDSSSKATASSNCSPAGTEIMIPGKKAILDVTRFAESMPVARARETLAKLKLRPDLQLRLEQVLKHASQKQLDRFQAVLEKLRARFKKKGAPSEADSLLEAALQRCVARHASLDRTDDSIRIAGVVYSLSSLSTPAE